MPRLLKKHKQYTCELDRVVDEKYLKGIKILNSHFKEMQCIWARYFELFCVNKIADRDKRGKRFVWLLHKTEASVMGEDLQKVCSICLIFFL